MFCLLETTTDNRRFTQPMMREVCLRVEQRFVTLDFAEINPHNANRSPVIAKIIKYNLLPFP